MKTSLSDVDVLGHNGDPLTTPQCTIESLWSALGAGANGLLLDVFITSDNRLVCTPFNTVPVDNKPDIVVSESTLSELMQIDAGHHYKSIVLDEHGQPTGDLGDDLPWIRKDLLQPPKTGLKNRRQVCFSELGYLLQHFSRRKRIALKIDTEIATQTSLIKTLADHLTRSGLQNKTEIVAEADSLATIKQRLPLVRLVLDASLSKQTLEAAVDVASELEAVSILASTSRISELTREQRNALVNKSKEHAISWIANLEKYAPSPDERQPLDEMKAVLSAVVTQGILPTRSSLKTPGIVFSEDFAGDTIDTRQWRAGYSSLIEKHGVKKEEQYPDCEIEQNNGLIIKLIDGYRYSGGAIVTAVPIHGDFDAIVDFYIEAPNQATTMEMAAIAIDPGYHNIDNSHITSKTANLSFDVHGSPPYASCERDQNDGFRCGWNNSYNLTRVSPDWESRSANMYNKYTRDVGDGSNKNQYGSLRLTRSGPVFSGYYKDGHNKSWVGCGSMLVQSMPNDCFIRLALKHWDKVPVPPANKVIYNNFVLRQS